MQIIIQLIQVDFVVFFTLVYLAVFIFFNKKYDRRISKRIMKTLVFITCLVISDNLDYYYSGLETPHSIHKYIIMAGYILRVFAIMSAVFVINEDKISKRIKFLLNMPAFINMLVILCALFTDNIFWIDEHNVLHRELLSYVPHITALSYFFTVLYIAIRRLLKNNKEEGIILIVSLCAVMLGVVSEIILKTRGILISAMSLMLTFYYLYLHIRHFKTDTLTGAFNRMTFFADIQNYKDGEITALSEIDMNGLKQINDELGHLSGDKAIMTVASTISKCLPPNTFLYRIGGDEFVILFVKTDMWAAAEVIKNIKNELSKTEYSCAIGTAQWLQGRTFDEVYNLVDKRMYEEKRKMKSTQK